MSKEHKMTKDGKKYITKISNHGCKECSFLKLSNCLIITNAKCVSYKNNDIKHLIWVEDTSKPNKEKCYWIVEEYSKILGWSFFDIAETRKKARQCIKDMIAEDKTRIRKYVPAK
jgi:hypothetical protein